MATVKQRLGAWILPRLPVNPWVFATIRLELNAIMVRLLDRFHPSWIARRRAVEKMRGVLVNLGCGGFGKEGWVNLDLFAAPNLTLRFDCREKLPLSDGAVRAIHVEHYFEHIEPYTERPHFLAECWRCLEPGGILRIIVPDMHKYIEGYMAPGRGLLDWEGPNGEKHLAGFPTKMEALNHQFLQGGEHYGGFDEDHLRYVLQQAGFTDIERVEWRTGRFPGGAIDLEHHRPFSLYMEARR